MIDDDCLSKHSCFFCSFDELTIDRTSSRITTSVPFPQSELCFEYFILTDPWTKNLHRQGTSSSNKSLEAKPELPGVDFNNFFKTKWANVKERKLKLHLKFKKSHPFKMTEIIVKMNEPLSIICIQNSEKKTTFEPLWNWSLPRISRSTVRFVTRQTWKKTTDPTSQISFASKDLMTSEFCGFLCANDFLRWWNNEIFLGIDEFNCGQRKNSLPKGSPTTLLKQTTLPFSFSSLISMAMLRPFHLDAWYFHWTWPRDCNRRPAGNQMSKKDTTHP